MSTLTVITPTFETLARQLAASEKQVQKALKRAIAVTARWAANEGRSGIAQSLGIRISALKGRVGVFIRTDEAIGKSFFGLNDLPSSRLNPRQTATGATMDGMKGEVAHGFVARGKYGASGRKFVWLREGKARFPIKMVGLPINNVGQNVIANDVFPRIEERLLRAFEHELRWEVSK